MFDTVDASLYYPSNGHAYFFKGPSYIKYRPGEGVVPLNGRVVRRIGVDGWKTFPDEFKLGVDAALYYPSRNAAYFFRGSNYIKYKPGDGVEALGNGRTIRRLGDDGWRSFPNQFKTGIDAAIYYRRRGHAYFFKHGGYIKYRPGSGVVPLNGNAIRRIGIDGWQDLPVHFRDGIDSALEYQANEFTYFFRGREYARWEPGEGLSPRYPRRLGLLYGYNMVDRVRGGWFGLSHLIGGPMVGRVSSRSASIWLWIASEDALDRVVVTVNNEIHDFEVATSGGTTLAYGIDSVWLGSRIAEITLQDLSPGVRYTVLIELDDVELDQVTFTSATEASDCGKVVFVFGSCSDISKHIDVPTFERMAEAQPDFAILCGDNCYYVNQDRTTTGGPRPRDWESVTRMLLRHLQARNHPQFSSLSRTVPLVAIWDDHDFAYNNAAGSDSRDYWVGRESAAAVFRAMWPNHYKSANDLALQQSFSWGTVEVFVTDTRFYKDVAAQTIWGDMQRDWLLGALISSCAPVKILVTSTQFLFNLGSQEGHAREAPDERNAIVDAVVNDQISGRLLILSGDVHYTELMRIPGDGPAKLLEFTSSPMRRDVDDEHRDEKSPGSRIWFARRDGFGIVKIDVKGVRVDGTVDGTIFLEARDHIGTTLQRGGVSCRSTWDLASGTIT